MLMYALYFVLTQCTISKYGSDQWIFNECDFTILYMFGAKSTQAEHARETQKARVTCGIRRLCHSELYVSDADADAFELFVFNGDYRISCSLQNKKTKTKTSKYNRVNRGRFIKYLRAPENTENFRKVCRWGERKSRKWPFNIKPPTYTEHDPLNTSFSTLIRYMLRL